MDYREQARSIIRQYRAKEDLTQDEFAEKAKISARSISQIESKKHVRDSTLNRALLVTGYELEVKRTIKPTSKPPEE